jgi:hypothetical protein
MKNLYYCLSIVVALSASCKKQDTENATEKNVTTEKTTGVQTSSLQETATILGGSWIAKDYLDNLKKNKAVYNNPNYTTSLFGMSFIKDSLATGSTLLYGFSPHEVTYSWPIYWNGKTGHFMYDPNEDIGDRPLDDFTLNLLGDDLLEVSFTKSGKKEVYQKADIEIALNELFTGTYTDEATGKTVTFTEDGSVKGLPGFVQYYVQFDPDAEEAVPFDALFMYAETSDEAGTPFHFKIKDNTLTLYNVDAKEVEQYVEYTYTVGSVAWVLTKK